MLTPVITTALDVLSRIKDEESGQGLTEYALILTLIALVAFATLAFFGGAVTTELSVVASSV